MWYYFLITEFIKHLLKAKTKLGFGIHSPYLFPLVKHLQKPVKNKKSIKAIENKRKKLLKNNSSIKITDYGTGSTKVKANGTRTVKSIAKYSLANKQKAILISKICTFLNPDNIIELGTSLGITTAYISTACPNAKIITIEGCPKTSVIASETFKSLNLTNVTLVNGQFDTALHNIIDNIDEINLVLFDGNHAKEPTLRYFNILKEKAVNNTVFIFDDIYYNLEMYNTWKIITQDNNITASLNFFCLGIVFFKKELSKQYLRVFY